MIEITQKNDWNVLRLISHLSPILLFKISNRCGLSAGLMELLQEVENDYNSPNPFSYLVVQNSRDLSNKIAKQTGIKHETPQIIILHQEQVIYFASHLNISFEDLVFYGRLTPKVQEATMTWLASQFKGKKTPSKYKLKPRSKTSLTKSIN